MAYYFSCNQCNVTNLFNDGNVTKLDPVEEYHLIKGVSGGAINVKEKEIVICKSCIKKETRLKGNYIIIWKVIKMRNDFNRLIPISIIASIAICIVLLRTMILDLNEFFGYRDIIIFMVVQFVLTFNIYLTIKLNWKGR